MDESALEYVGFWPRVGASIIDTVMLMLVTTPLLFWIYGSDYYLDASRGLLAGPADFFISLVCPAVAIILFWHFRQATPGKMLLSLRIVDATTGQGMTSGQSLLRYVGYFVALLPLGLGILWVAFDPRKQGWHDKLAKTVVVRPKNREPKPVRFGNG